MTRVVHSVDQGWTPHPQTKTSGPCCTGWILTSRSPAYDSTSLKNWKVMVRHLHWAYQTSHPQVVYFPWKVVDSWKPKKKEEKNNVKRYARIYTAVNARIIISITKESTQNGYVPFSPQAPCCSSGWNLYQGSRTRPQTPDRPSQGKVLCVPLSMSSSLQCQPSLLPPFHYQLSEQAKKYIYRVVHHNKVDNKSTICISIVFQHSGQLHDLIPTFTSC